MDTHSSQEVKTAHHRVIFVLQIVAVEHVTAAKLLEPNHHQRLFTCFEGYGVLPTFLVGKWRLAVPLQNLEVGEMYVGGVRSAQEPQRRLVAEPPEFSLS